jgi:hypothetical protein
MLQWKKQTGNEVFFETTIDKTKFTFMADTTKAKSGMIDDNSSTKSGTKSGTKGGKWVIIKP